MTGFQDIGIDFAETDQANFRLTGGKDALWNYTVETHLTPVAFIAIVGIFVALTITLAAPLACWSRKVSEREKIRNTPQTSEDSTTTGPENNNQNPDVSPQLPESAPVIAYDNTPQNHPKQAPANSKGSPTKLSSNVTDLGIFHREHLAAMKSVAKEMGRKVSPEPGKLMHSDPDVKHLHQEIPFHHSAERLSAVPSVATTSRLYGGNLHGKRRSFQGQSRLPWRHGNPIPRPKVVQQAVEMERQSRISGEGAGGECASGSHHSRSRSSWGNGQSSHVRPRVISEAAGSILEGESVEGEAEFYRRKYKTLSRRDARSRHSRNPSYGGSDLGSVMPPLDPDAISPDDAADAHDPGRIPYLIQPYEYQTNRTAPTSVPSLEASNVLSARLLNILDLAEPDYETRRIIVLAIPSTIGAVADPVFRIILVAIISHFIDADSMVAYLIVILFIRLTTEEISGAITDTESNLLHDTLLQDGEHAFFKAGQIIQLSIVLQLAIGIPVLVMWYFLMDDVALWLIGSQRIAKIAAEYTGVIIIDYILRGASRTFMLPFYLTGQAQFEANIDLSATILTLVAIAVVAKNYNLSLAAIGWVQVILGIAKMITKVAYVSLRGWVQPYKQGLLEMVSFKNPAAVTSFLFQAFPLFLGSLLELGEWEVLILFVSHLGGAEVATWAIMGVIWEIFVALTEGLGEAASIRVSFFLTEGQPELAKRLANKVAFMSFILVLGVTSIFLMVGPNLAVLLTKNMTLQHLFCQLVGFAGLANASMTFAQVYWSLAGAQDRYSVASATILFCRWFIVLPMASICIFRYFLDLTAVAGAVAVGYTVASVTLAFLVFRSDWNDVASSFQEDFDMMHETYPLDDDALLCNFEDEPISSNDDDEEEDSAESDSTGLPFGDGNIPRENYNDDDSTLIEM